MFCQGLGESLPFLSFYKLLLIIRQVANPKKIPAPPGAGGNLDGICDIWLIIVNQGGRMGWSKATVVYDSYFEDLGKTFYLSHFLGLLTVG